MRVEKLKENESSIHERILTIQDDSALTTPDINVGQGQIISPEKSFLFLLKVSRTHISSDIYKVSTAQIKSPDAEGQSSP